MDISYNWLRTVAPSITRSPREIADALGMLGAPVDELAPLGEALGDILIARIEEVRPHPNADRLRLCTVNAGGEELQVVCGAPNVEAGKYYPFAPIGASLPGGINIKKAKLRGEVSQGMLCSARELGLGREHEGLMTLSGEWPAGASFVEEMGLDDWRLVLDVTPNRPDLLSHAGVARELAPGGVADIELAPFSDGYSAPEVASVETSGELAGVAVEIEDPALCPRYMAAVVRGVKVGSSPEWLATRLRAIGLRPINNVVDATNYVLHEMGQPLHAFDLAKLNGPAIRVRHAKEGETLRTLDGIDRKLEAGMLVIADAEHPVAVAGVMGGEESEVSAETVDLLLECARFDERSVRRTARALGLSTDASFRFERGVDPELQAPALARLVDLILKVAGGTAESTMLDVSPAPAVPTVVELRPDRVSALLGIDIDAGEIEGLLAPIGFTVEESSSKVTLRVRVPGYRPDVTREVDLIEEVARRRGYDSFPELRVAFRPSAVPEDALLGVERRVRAVLSRWGFMEARTAAFAPAGEARVPLLNPLSSEESHLRDALTPGLLGRVEHNWAHGVRHIRLYEVGTAFFPATDSAAREVVRVAAVFTGATRPPHWTAEDDAYDAWDLKALMAELAQAVDGEAPVPGADPVAEPSFAAAAVVLQPGATLQVSAAGGGVIGIGGRVSAQRIDAPAWSDPVWSLELDLPAETATAARSVTYAALPEHPASERDLALLVPEATAASEVERVIVESGGNALSEVRPFDVYEGPGVEAGTRSIAWRLRFRLQDRTLTDREVDAAVDRILDALEDRLRVVRR